MQSHFESLEADWLRYYNRNFKEDLYGVTPLGWRYINSLLVWLPADAAVWRSAKTSWSDEKELLAVNIEVVDALRRAFIVANSKKGSKEPEPVKIARPWHKVTPTKRGTSLTELLTVMKMPIIKQNKEVS